jgi:TRAP-type transport system small permease protein
MMINRWLDRFAALVLALMAVVAFGDVALRVLWKPITGAYELTALLVGLLVYAALPYVTAQDNHVRAGVFGAWLDARPKLVSVLLRLRQVLTALTFALLSWALVQYALRVASAGDKAPFIDIPLYWVASFGALSFACAVFLAFRSNRAASGKELG